MEHAEHITSPEMTAELDAEMDRIASGNGTRARSFEHCASCSATSWTSCWSTSTTSGELKAAADEDAKVGTCPKSGHDLLIKYSPKSKSYFVGCRAIRTAT